MQTRMGIDWSEAHHDVRIHSEAGVCLARSQIPPTLSGFQQLEAQIQRVNPEPSACLVAIETADNLLVDFLRSRGGSAAKTG
jgi:hypothetical protein